MTYLNELDKFLKKVEHPLEENKKQGISVEHPMKNKIKEIIPENYQVIAKFNTRVINRNGKNIFINKNIRAWEKLNFSEQGFLKNIRDLKSFKNGENPYDQFVEVEPKDVRDFKLNTDKEVHGIFYVTETKPDAVGEVDTYINIVMFEKLEVLSKNTLIEEIEELSDIDEESNNEFGVPA